MARGCALRTVFECRNLLQLLMNKFSSKCHERDMHVRKQHCLKALRRMYTKYLAFKGFTQTIRNKKLIRK